MVLFSALVAALYGAIHDQISFTVSNKYFTKFKFKQFNVSWGHDYPRMGAAYVGVLATWWMGVWISLILGLFAFRFKEPSAMAQVLMRSILIVLIIALITGVSGLVFGCFRVNSLTIAEYQGWVSEGVSHPIEFVRVGFMHNFSYLGGALGLLGGILLILTRGK